MEDNRIIKIYLDNEKEAFAEFSPPIKFVLDTTKIPDGKHQLKIVAKSTSGKEGIKFIPFEVRNGPDIQVSGIDHNEIVSDSVSITINSYGSERNDIFLIRGAETPKAIPSWVWFLVIAFIAFGLFYIIMYWTPDLYTPFF